MNRIDRLLGILTVLQSKTHVPAETIAGRFDISIRTVYRDIKALTELGIPIGFENQKGYFIVQGYFLPPVSFSGEEANALILMGALTEKYADGSIRKHYENALNKIRAILRYADKEKIDQLSENIRVYQSDNEADGLMFLSDIQSAIIHKRIIHLSYTNIEGIHSSRDVEPIGLTFYCNQWHMIAWCWKRQAYRDFKTTRITRLKLTNTPFKKQKHLDINAYIKLLE